MSCWDSGPVLLCPEGCLLGAALKADLAAYGNLSGDQEVVNQVFCTLGGGKRNHK